MKNVVYFNSPSVRRIDSKTLASPNHRCQLTIAGNLDVLHGQQEVQEAGVKFPYYVDPSLFQATLIIALYSWEGKI